MDTMEPPAPGTAAAKNESLLSEESLPDIWTQVVPASYLDTLILAQSFGEFWAYYSQSNGVLYEEACRKTGTALSQAITALFHEEQGSLEAVQRVINAHSDLGDIEKIVTTLHVWSVGTERWPYEGQRETRWTLGPFLMGLKIVCLQKTGGAARPYLTLYAGELDYSTEVLRWKGHLPPKVLDSKNIEAQIIQANQTPSIVVVGDIRRSQDLMTYALSGDSFGRRLVEFVEGTRKIVEENGGIFDKFTGDGFVAYFNQAVSQTQELDYLDSFLCFVEQQSHFSKALFADWVEEIRKMPPGIGLAMGADIGTISLQHRAGHLIAVGDTLVWATRMASEARADETVINNALYHAVKNKPQITFTERASQTKTGEAFLARTLHPRP